MIENKLKAALARGDMQIGTWLNMGSDAATEMAGNAGFDWCLIDGEHAPFDISVILQQLRVLAACEASPVVRVPVGEAWVIKQVLDLGAQSLLVPMVDTPDQAAAMVAATRYAPNGVRGMGAAVARASGYGADPAYVHHADSQICLLLQAETRTSLENLDAILATEGIDGIFIGPVDLSADMGYPGNPGAPEVKAAIKDAVGRIRAAGKTAGIIHYGVADFAYYQEIGVNFLGVSSEAALLRSAMQNVVASARAALS